MVGMMGWAIPEQGWRKGPWTHEEDRMLSHYVNLHGEGRWSSVARGAGLNRSGKSCRLRWVNYLRPGLKKGQLTPQEEGIIIELHALWGNKWSTIARYLPGRTDNEIKNYWRTHLKKRERSSQKQDKRKSQALKQKWLQQQQQEQVNAAQLSDEKMQTEGNPQQTIPTQNNSTNLENYQGLSHQEVVAPWVDDIWLWSELWNLDDGQGDHVDLTSNCNKIAMQDQVPASNPCGGSSNNFYGGGYIY